MNITIQPSVLINEAIVESITTNINKYLVWDLYPNLESYTEDDIVIIDILKQLEYKAAEPETISVNQVVVRTMVYLQESGVFTKEEFEKSREIVEFLRKCGFEDAVYTTNTLDTSDLALYICYNSFPEYSSIPIIPGFYEEIMNSLQIDYSIPSISDDYQAGVQAASIVEYYVIPGFKESSKDSYNLSTVKSSIYPIAKDDPRIDLIVGYILDWLKSSGFTEAHHTLIQDPEIESTLNITFYAAK